MFLLYPVALGLLVGVLAGGHVARLERVRFLWGPLALVGLAVQVILFSPFVAGRVGAAGPLIYVASTAAVVLVALRNAAQPGLGILALGGALNLAAILANGGYMPADPGALAALGRTIDPGTYSNSVPGGGTAALVPLTDLFALPRGLPGANVFSIGDVLIAAGVFVWLVTALRRRTGAE